MVYGAVQCPHCHSTEVIKAGKQPKGAQRYRCQNPLCERQLFLLHYQDRGRLPEVRRQVVDMAVKGRGIRDTARVLRINPTTVIAVLKKVSALHPLHAALLHSPCGRDGPLRVPSRREAEMEERWSFVGDQDNERWLGHAIAHGTGKVLASVLGSRKDAVFLKLQVFLAPFGLTRYYRDQGGASRRHLPPEQHPVGKLAMQKLERTHLTLRTRLKRLARKTLCFSRSCVMPDLVLGLHMNHVEFGCDA
jgi:insertion element IS1 protein InsB